MTAATNPGKYVDFDEYVGLKLEKTRASIRTTDILTALAGVAAMTLGYLLLFVVLDQWVIPDGFSVGWRMVLLSTLVISVAGWLIWKVGIPSFRTVNGLFAAKEIERAEPELRSNLLNLVDLKAAGRPINPVILQAIERQTAVKLQQVDVSSVVDHRPLVRTAYLLLAVIVVFCIYAMLSPKKISSSIWRGLVPLAQVPLATITEILDVKPGDTTVPVHQPFVDIQVDLAGEIPAQVVLFYSTADGKQDQPLELRADEEGQPRYRGQLIGDSGQGLIQDITYIVRAGDATSRRYRIHVEQPPYADLESLRLEFPSYMKLPPVDQPHNGTIDAWEGAIATVTANTNMPVRSGTIQFLDDPQNGPNGEEVSMSVSAAGKRLQAQWTLSLRSDGTFPKYYRIHCKTEDDRVTTGHVNFPITIRPDAAPQVTLVQPDRDLEAPANATVPLLIQAQDPDFELGYVYVNVEKSGQRILHEQVSEGRIQRLMLKHDLELKRLQAVVGDTFDLWIEAQDNKRPRPNSRNTPKVKIRVVEPVSKKQADEQLAADKERLDQKIAEANDEPNQDANPPRDGETKERSPSENPRTEDATARREDPPEQPAEEPQNGQQENPDEKNQGQQEKTAERGDSRNGSGQANTQQKSTKGGTSKPDESNAESGSGSSKPDKPLDNDGSRDDEIIKKISEKLKQDQRSKADATKDSANKDQTEEQKSGDANAEPKPDLENGSKPDDSKPSTAKKPSKPDAKSARKGERSPESATEKNSPSDEAATDSADSKQESDRSKNTAEKSRTDKPSTDGSAEDQKPGMKDSNKETNEAPGEKKQADTKSKTDPAKNAADPGKSSNADEKTTGDKPEVGDESKNDPVKPPKPEASDDGSDQKGPATSEGKPAKKPSDMDKPEGDDAPKGSNAADEGSQKKSPDPSKESSEGEKNSDQDQAEKNSDQAGKEKSGTEKSGTEKSGTESGPKSDADSKKAGESAKEPSEAADKPSDSSKPGKKASNTDPKAAKKNGASDMPPEKGNPDDVSDQQKRDKSSRPTKPNPNGRQEKTDKSQDDQNSDTDREPSKNTDKSGKNDKSPKSTDKPASPDDQETDSTQSKSDSAGKEGSKGSSKGDGKSGSKDGQQSQGGKPDGSPSESGDSKNQSNEGEDQPADGAGKPGESGKNSDKGSGKDSGDQASPKSDDPQGESEPSGDQKSDKADANKGDSGAEKSDSDQPGADKPGGDKPGGEKSDDGKSGSKGQGKSESGKSSSGKGQGKQGDKGQGSGKSGSGSKPSAGKGKTGGNSDNPGGGESGEGSDPSPPGSNAAEVGASEEANLEYNRQATELILQKLKKDLERGDVDPELLEQLGWTPAELKKFADRLSKSLNESKQPEETPASRARQQQFQEMLKNLDLQKTGTRRSGEKEPQREVNQVDSKRAPAPPAYQKIFEKFTKDQARQKPAASKPASK